VARASFGTPARYASTSLAGALFASVFLMVRLLFSGMSDPRSSAAILQ